MNVVFVEAPVVLLMTSRRMSVFVVAVLSPMYPPVAENAKSGQPELGVPIRCKATIIVSG